jgi:hypothetical protein
LQTSLEDSEWRTNIHGAKKHEAWGNWVGGGFLCKDSNIGSWIINTNHRQFLDYCVQGGLAIIPQTCDHMDEDINTITS